jgi:hypothetical protein
MGDVVFQQVDPWVFERPVGPVPDFLDNLLHPYK